MLTLKNYGAPNKMGDVRFVAQQFDDKDNPFMFHNTSTVQSTLIRLMLSTAAIHRFLVFFRDVTQTYLQSRHKLTC